MNEAAKELLRQLPSVDHVLRHSAMQEPAERHSREQVVEWIRTALDISRGELLNNPQQALCADDSVGSASSSKLVHRVCDLVTQFAEADRAATIQKVINGSGVLLHTNLGRAPLSTAAIERSAAAARATNVELDLASGRRARRGDRVCRLLAKLTGAEDALVVNNCAAATILALQTIAMGREVIISRGQLVEIGGGFRLPEVFVAAGVTLREVGTTNRTYLRDYVQSLNEQTGAVLRVHRSNFRQSGFTCEPSINDLAAASELSEIPLIDDIGSGCVHDLSPWGLLEPSVQDSVRAGADLTLFSGDKLFGGPQCGVVVGKSKWVDSLRTSPMMRALRADKLILAALEATTEIHLCGAAFQQVPVLQMIAEAPEAVRRACEQIVDAVPVEAAAATQATLSVEASQSVIGGGTLPDSTLPSFSVRVTTHRPIALAHALRQGEIPLQARIADDSVWLDVRTVLPSDRSQVAGLLVAAMQRQITSTDSQRTR